jgi:hypothetical protein
MLEKVNKQNPQKRPKNRYDEWFESHIKVLARHYATLSYISEWGYLEDTFWRLLPNPEADYAFQKTLIKLNDCNMLYTFVRKYDFLPAIKKKLHRYPEAQIYYETYH